jgi:hypothetical protein
MARTGSDGQNAQPPIVNPNLETYHPENFMTLSSKVFEKMDMKFLNLSHDRK